MKEYNVKIIMPKDNTLTIKEMEEKIKEFQSIFITVASRYYSQKRRNTLGEAE
jgi:hypothetical protein